MLLDVSSVHVWGCVRDFAEPKKHIKWNDVNDVKVKKLRKIRKGVLCNLFVSRFGFVLTNSYKIRLKSQQSILDAFMYRQ